MGCRLYLAGSAAGYTLLDHRGAPLSNATNGGRNGPLLLTLLCRNSFTKAAASIKVQLAILEGPLMRILVQPCRLTGAHWSGFQWGVW